MHLNPYINHTLLKPTSTLAEIQQLCNEAKMHEFAAVCVPPLFVKKCKEFLKDSMVKVATVVGFPFGYSAVEAKLAEILLAMVDVADELDVVINIMAVKNNDWPYISNEINHLIPVIKSENKVIKVNVESGVLTKDELKKCCELYSAAGVDYLITSTGYAEKGATVEAVELMRKYLPGHVQIKAFGGIGTYDFARQLIQSGATRLGCSVSVAILNKQITENNDY